MRTKKAFTRDEKGVTAIEFAILAPLFLTLLFSLFESGYAYTKISLANRALTKVARDIYTGQASNGHITYDDLESDFCANFILGGDDCTDNLTIELTVIDNLTDLPDNDAKCKYTNIPIAPVVKYNTGGASSIIYMRACYVTNILVPGIGFGLHLPKIDGNKFAIISSTAFVNEPF